MSDRIIYHGSSEIIEHPVYGKGKSYNDYGRGFYCTESLELAREWACTEGINGFANQYAIETEGLKILNLTSAQYSILHWLTLLVTFRKFRLSTPLMKKGVQWLQENYSIDLSSYDAIIGYRADDSYFSFARAFVNNEISLEQLQYAMKLGKLGEQFVLKSPKAFDMVRFISAVPADNVIYYARRKARDEKARAAYFAELEKQAMDGVYIRDLIRKGGRRDDTSI
ncbi:MAG: DUF3990 domain-containing protein [Lachnospiraceae bacterium]